jgi:hypothetical protein
MNPSVTAYVIDMAESRPRTRRRLVMASVSWPTADNSETESVFGAYLIRGCLAGRS